MSFPFRKLHFFKKQQCLEKLKEDASTIQRTMDYIDERLDNPCEIYDASKCRSSEQLLNKELEDVQQQQSDITEYVELSRQNHDEMKQFITETDSFIDCIETNLKDIESHLAKFGMKPMAQVQENIVSTTTEQ